MPVKSQLGKFFQNSFPCVETLHAGKLSASFRDLNKKVILSKCCHCTKLFDIKTKLGTCAISICYIMDILHVLSSKFDWW